MLAEEKCIQSLRKIAQTGGMIMFTFETAAVGKGIIFVLETEQICHVVIGSVICLLRWQAMETARLIARRFCHSGKKGGYIIEKI